jgi:hypothetical protein
LKGSFIERKAESRTISMVTTLKEGYLTTEGGHFLLKKYLIERKARNYWKLGQTDQLQNALSTRRCSVILGSSKMLSGVIVRIHRLKLPPPQAVGSPIHRV